MKTLREHSCRLDFPKRIDALIDQTEKFAMLCHSPKRTEFKFCAFLAAWEATSLHDSGATHWLVVWQEQCQKQHDGKLGLTLADPRRGHALFTHLHPSKHEIAKAYATVTDGLKRVLESTLKHHSVQERRDFRSDRGIDTAGVLLQLTRNSFKVGKSFASPEGFEFFLLTLLEVFELSLGVPEHEVFSRNAWFAETRRRRLGGNPETRTLADVAPEEIRLKRQKAYPEKKRLEVLTQMLASMRKVIMKMQSYLEKHG